MRFSVVIPTCNRRQTLALTLAAVTAQDWTDYEVIVVDDGSRDGTADLVRGAFPQVQLLSQANGGPARARNTGLQAARGELVAFTDDDCQVPPDWLSRLAAGFERHPDITGAGGPLLAPAELRRTNPLARYEAYVVQVQYRAQDTEVLGGFDCPAGGTNNMAYRREALTSVGGFDAAFPYPAAEDADLKWRLAQAGARFLYLPVVVTHLQPYTWPAFRRQQFTRGKGRAYFDRKWGRRPAAWRIGLRLLAGLLRLPGRPHLPPALYRPALEELWFNALGQWAALKELRA